MKLKGLLLIALSTPVSAGMFPNVGVDIAFASFKNARQSTDAIGRVIGAEGFNYDTNETGVVTNLFPVIGFQFNKTWGIEAGYRSFEWATTLEGDVGKTSLYNVVTGSPAVTPIGGATFSSSAITTFRAYTIGITYSHSISENGSMYLKPMLTISETCSGVYEMSDAVGRTPKHLESAAGLCSTRGSTRDIGYAYAFTVGYRHKLKNNWSISGYVEAMPDVGNEGVVFVDGAGIENQTLLTYGLILSKSFGN